MDDDDDDESLMFSDTDVTLRSIYTHTQFDYAEMLPIHTHRK